ncbi:MAG: hypothetical protein INR69_15125 [Mucilaginibacter polytrichastri]|nr:hypothetical protein [Mucilaginibacter polytrichastri]
MTEKPIPFAAEMVRSILNVTKTVTRRVMKEQPVGLAGYHDAGFMHKPLCQFENKETGEIEADVPASPFGWVGGLLWVQEPWATVVSLSDQGYSTSAHYQATEPDAEVVWKPIIQMPKELARIWLRVTHVRVERLQDIDASDAIHEGIEKHDIENGFEYKNYLYKPGPLKSIVKPFFSDAVDSFRSFWQTIHGVGSWAKNPFVFVVEFELISTTGRPAIEEEAA